MRERLKPKVLIFQDGHLVPVLRGDKRVTLRLYRPEAHTFYGGEMFVGSFTDGKEGQGLDVMLQATDETTLTLARNLPDDLAREDGFPNAQAVLNKMGTYYPSLSPSSELAIIRFDVAKIREVPVVQFNNLRQR